MQSKIVITWTIFLFSGVVFPSSSTGAPTENKSKVSETMYDAIAKKCPAVEVTNLKNNSTIFTKDCLNWDKINATNVFNDETKQDVLCLVYYESLVSFCTKLGENAHKFKGLITPNIAKEKYNVCAGNISIYPKNNTKSEHDISKLLPDYTGCLKLCWDGQEIRDICNLAYYFNTFNFTMLDSYIALKQKSNNAATLIPQVNSNTKEISTVVEKQPSEVGSSKNPAPVFETIPVASNKNPQADPKPKLTVQDVKNEKSPEVLNEKPKDIVAVENSLAEPEKQPAKKTEKPPELVAPQKVIPVHEEMDKNSEVKETQVNPVGEDKHVPNEDQFEEQNIEQQEQEEEDEEEGIPEEPLRNNEENLEKDKKVVKPDMVEESPISSFAVTDEDMDGNSYFFSYFTVLMCLCIAGYVGYHNRQKILALILEGKKGRKPGRGRRPNSANYHKLDSNLEEAMSSSCPKPSSNVIY
ncbi:trans-Golgi network integral membrane protein 2-like [Sitophilus oryzae]|uniref:Trans-Golgi network integral membrane protein 2-like n=1 Tax=Sitophilus oryzae TaxID=7048 RepID=A0A6J2XVX7_SITOR|nr:trans-Golgi network integral membrane protein 2-like [Sitophilus oryzae]